MQPDVVEQIGETRRWLANPRGGHGPLGHAGGEDHEGPPSREGGRRRQEAVEVERRVVGDRLAGGVVVPHEVVLRDPELVSDRRVAQVQDVEVDDIDGADTFQHLERRDARVDEVAEQLGPRGLLLIGGVPRGLAAAAVVPAIATGRIRVRLERVASGALVPEATGDAPWRDGGDPVDVGRQT